MRRYCLYLLVPTLLLAITPAVAPGQSAPDMPPPVITMDATTAEYVPLPGFPRGTDFHVVSGDPRTGPFAIFLRLQPGVTVPMHFHSSAENAVGIQGQLRMRHEDGTMNVIGPGTYMFIPWQMPHEPSCTAGGPVCITYFSFDRAFDTSWVGTPPVNPNPMPGENP